MMVHDTLKQKEEFNNSKFYMWRCVTAMAHADGFVDRNEVDHLKGIFDKMFAKEALNQEKYDVLINDLAEEQNISSLFAQINDPKYRAQVIHFARLLAYKDGEFSPSEEQLLKRLHIDLTSGLDLETIRKEIQYEVQQEIVLNEIENDSKRPMTGLFGAIDWLALKFDIDLMD